MKSQNTLPELLLEQSLRQLGASIETHCRDLPGTPDIVFREARMIVFVHGCFWHRHFQCSKARTPKTHTFEWLRRFAATVERDQLTVQALTCQGWKSFVAWECEVLNDPKRVGSSIMAEAYSHQSLVCPDDARESNEFQKVGLLHAELFGRPGGA